MKFNLLLVLVLSYASSNAQVYTEYRRIQPNWDNYSSEVIKSEKIKNDSVYFYKKRNKNIDSALTLTQYFDSLGNLTERDEYSSNGVVFIITKYTHIDTVLLKEETISKDIFFKSDTSLSKEIRTYSHDNFGNVTTEKEYDFFGNALKSMSVTVWDREYDSLGNLIKEIITLPTGEKYLYHTFSYVNGILSEIKTYDNYKNWIYSYLYEYTGKMNKKSVYLYNTDKTLSHEYFYKEKKLILEKSYDQGNYFLFSDHNTQSYFYNSSGLLESQIFQDIIGKNHYFKHFYSK